MNEELGADKGLRCNDCMVGGCSTPDLCQEERDDYARKYGARIPPREANLIQDISAAQGWAGDDVRWATLWKRIHAAAKNAAPSERPSSSGTHRNAIQPDYAGLQPEGNTSMGAAPVSSSADKQNANALCDLMREHADYMGSYSEPFVGSTEAIARNLRMGADYIQQLERELAEAKDELRHSKYCYEQAKASVSATDAKDAARYRWLKENSDWSKSEYPGDIDADIDAAIDDTGAGK